MLFASRIIPYRGSWLDIEFDDGTTSHLDDTRLPGELSTTLFERTGRIRKVTVTVIADTLFGD